MKSYNLYFDIILLTQMIPILFCMIEKQYLPIECSKYSQDKLIFVFVYEM
jgi:hypothetical protein